MAYESLKVRMIPPMASVAELLKRMDDEYHQAAFVNGFECRGCEDNCCHTRFHHHTLAEYLYMKEGFRLLPEANQQQVRERAADVVQRMNDLDQAGQPVRVLCPLNEGQRCILYAYRPMICRLHGIPHQLRRPDGQRQVGPGCGDFDRQCDQGDAALLDRTPLYIALAELEKELRSQMEFAGRIRMTIAEMVVSDFFEG